jgi:RNA binding exosome subunit
MIRAEVINLDGRDAIRATTAEGTALGYFRSVAEFAAKGWYGNPVDLAEVEVA